MKGTRKFLTAALLALALVAVPHAKVVEAFERPDRYVFNAE